MPGPGGEKPHGWLILSSTIGSLPVPKWGGGIRLLFVVDSKNGSALFPSKPQWGVDGGLSRPCHLGSQCGYQAIYMQKDTGAGKI